MPSIHVKDKLAARYAILTGDTEDFKDFVNSVVEEAMKQEEEKAELARQKKEKESEKQDVVDSCVRDVIYSGDIGCV